MRRFLILTFALLAVASTALAATSTVKLPTVFAHQLAALHAKGIGPILLPQTMPKEAKHVYPTVDVDGKNYELDLGAVANCHGANACFVAEFSARHMSPFPGAKVKLHGGVTGYYKGLTCGGSCSPPSIDFVQSGFDYTISVNFDSEKHAKTTLISMADSALEHGAR
jgi:hypothetical protein